MTQLQAFSLLVEVTPTWVICAPAGGLHRLPLVGMSQSTQGDLQSSRQARGVHGARAPRGCAELCWVCQFTSWYPLGEGREVTTFYQHNKLPVTRVLFLKEMQDWSHCKYPSAT